MPRSGSIRLAILDLDQTLIDTLHRFHAAFSQALERVGGMPPGWEEFVRMYSEDRLDEYIPDGIDPGEFWRDFARRHAEIRHPGDRLIEGAREALEELRGMGIRIVVTTGRRTTEDSVWGELRRFGLDGLVDGVYTLGQHEPNSGGLWHRHELIQRILSDFGVDPGEAVFVGDYWVDVESAKMAGVLSVGVLTGLEPEERLRRKGADHVIPGVWELPWLLRTLASRDS